MRQDPPGTFAGKGPDGPRPDDPPARPGLHPHTEPAPPRASRAAGTARQVAILLGLGGLWLAASPFVLGYESSAATANDVACGLLIAALAALHAFRPIGTDWAAWTAAGTAGWVALTPALFRHADWPAMTNEVVSGALLFAAAMGSAMLARKRPGARGG